MDLKPTKKISKWQKVVFVFGIANVIELVIFSSAMGQTNSPTPTKTILNQAQNSTKSDSSNKYDDWHNCFFMLESSINMLCRDIKNCDVVMNELKQKSDLSRKQIDEVKKICNSGVELTRTGTAEDKFETRLEPEYVKDLTETQIQFIKKRKEELKKEYLRQENLFLDSIKNFKKQLDTDQQKRFLEAVKDITKQAAGVYKVELEKGRKKNEEEFKRKYKQGINNKTKLN